MPFKLLALAMTSELIHYDQILLLLICENQDFCSPMYYAYCMHLERSCGEYSHWCLWWWHAVICDICDFTMGRLTLFFILVFVNSLGHPVLFSHFDFAFLSLQDWGLAPVRNSHVILSQIIREPRKTNNLIFGEICFFPVYNCLCIFCLSPTDSILIKSQGERTWEVCRGAC